RALLVGYLRPCNVDPARHAWAILSPLVQRLREAWPKLKITFRADSGLCRSRLLRWCERHDVGSIAGLARNKCLERLATPYLDDTEALCERHGRKQRHFYDLHYAARSWDKKRR